MPRLHRRALLAALVYVSACANGATSALLTVSASSPETITSLYGQVAIAASPPHEEQRLGGPLQLPGTLMVLLPDTAELVTVSLHSVSDTGELFGAIQLHSIPYRQIMGSVTLTPGPSVPPGPIAGGGADGGIVGDFGTATLDGGVAATTDFASVDMTRVVLAQDDFRRGDQSFWGTASDGNVWDADANSSAAFSIATDTGIIAPTQTGNLTGALGPTVADADVVVTGSISSFTTTSNNNELAAMLRWTDNNHFYKAGIDGDNLRIFVRTASNSSSTLATMPFSAAARTAYAIRFRAVGTSFMAKVWPASATEPTAWMLAATDVSLAEGACGLRIVFNSTAKASFTSFVATTP
jgi:hypothetical protein